MKILAFSQLSTTTDHHIPDDVAVMALVHAIETFINGSSVIESDPLKLLCVVTTGTSGHDQLQELTMKYGRDRFEVVVDTSLVSLCSNGLCVKGELLAIVNSANHRLSGRGGMINQMVHLATGTGV